MPTKPFTKHFKNCNLRPEPMPIYRLSGQRKPQPAGWQVLSQEIQNHTKDSQRCKKGPEEYVFWLWLFLGFPSHYSLSFLLFFLLAGWLDSGVSSLKFPHPSASAARAFHHLLRHQPHVDDKVARPSFAALSVS